MTFDAEPDTDGNLLTGILMGCGVQLIFIILGIFLFSGVSPQGSQGSKIGNWALLGWGLTQWIGLVPLILHQRGKGRPKTMYGLLIAGGIGLLLNSACDGLVFRGFG